MALDLSGLSNATTTATALSNLILVTPQTTIGYQPQNFPSWKKDTTPLPPSLLFHYEGEQTAQLTSDITDHFVEDNSAIQDQIALRPVIITTQGFVGELNDIAPKALLPVKVAAEKLTTISAYVPALSVTALRAYSQAAFLYSTAKNVANAAVAAWSTINGQSGGGQAVISGTGITPGGEAQNKQQIYFQQLYGYWQKRALFTVQTPWAVFQDMAIQSLRAVQNAETRVISDFEITFKQMRFASTLSTTIRRYSDAQFQGRLNSQGAQVVDLGVNVLDRSPVAFPF